MTVDDILDLFIDKGDGISIFDSTSESTYEFDDKDDDEINEYRSLEVDSFEIDENKLIINVTSDFDED